jgi:hypothetical protein
VECRIVVDRTVVAVAAAWVPRPVIMKVASEIARTLTWVEPWVVVDIAAAGPCQSAPHIHQSCLVGCSEVSLLQGWSS